MIHYLLSKMPAPSSGLLWVMSIGVGAPAVLIVLVLDPDLAFTALSVLLFAGAAIAALLAFGFRTEWTTPNPNLWDVAGGLVLTGCAASFFGEPENAALLFEHLFERRATTQ
jgi:multisubunit Na+/H+ antiporter MnhB subunit